MKKVYMQPTVVVVNTEHQHLLLEISGGDTGITGGGGGSAGQGHSRHFNVWDDNWDEDLDK